MQLFIPKLRACALRILPLFILSRFWSFHTIRYFLTDFPRNVPKNNGNFLSFSVRLSGANVSCSPVFGDFGPVAGFWLRCSCNKAKHFLQNIAVLNFTFAFSNSSRKDGRGIAAPGGIYRYFSRNSFSSANPPWGHRTSLPLRLRMHGVSRKVSMPSF